jgi:hypothetical protein
MKRSTKAGIKRDHTPAVLRSLQNSGVLPISGCVAKTSGDSSIIDMSNFSLGRSYGNAFAESFQSPLYHTIKLKNNKFTNRTCQNICAKINPNCKRVDLSRNNIGLVGTRTLAKKI